MPRTHLLDTSVYSQPVRRTMHPAVASRWDAVDHENTAISAIYEAEVLYGLKKHGSAKMQDTYDTLLRGRFPVLAVDSDVAATYADLRADCEKRGLTVDGLDLLIAATAKTHGLTVATLNAAHFTVIPDLLVEDWSIESVKR